LNSALCCRQFGIPEDVLTLELSNENLLNKVALEYKYLIIRTNNPKTKHIPPPISNAIIK